MFGSRKVLRKEKKCQGKWFSYIWFFHEKYKTKSNIIKIYKKKLYILKLFNTYIIEGNK